MGAEDHEGCGDRAPQLSAILVPMWGPGIDFGGYGVMSTSTFIVTAAYGCVCTCTNQTLDHSGISF